MANCSLGLDIDLNISASWQCSRYNYINLPMFQYPLVTIPILNDYDLNTAVTPPKIFVMVC